MNPQQASIPALRLILISLVIGASVLFGVMLVVSSFKDFPDLGVPWLPFALAGLALVAMAVSFVVMPSVMPRPVAEMPEEECLKKYMTELLLRAAVLEAPAIFCI